MSTEENTKLTINNLYSEDEQAILDHSIGIMGKLVKQYNHADRLENISIDKTDSVIRVVDAATKVTMAMASNKIKIAQMTNESDDRSRLVSILSNMEIRRPNTLDSARVIDLTDEEISAVDVNLVRGELSDGVEQLSLELLDLEKEVLND